MNLAINLRKAAPAASAALALGLMFAVTSTQPAMSSPKFKAGAETTTKAFVKAGKVGSKYTVKPLAGLVKKGKWGK